MISIEDIKAAIATHGSQNAAAKALGIARSTLRRQLLKAEIQVKSVDNLKIDEPNSYLGNKSNDKMSRERFIQEIIIAFASNPSIDSILKESRFASHPNVEIGIVNISSHLADYYEKI